jgi:hypothetical protein
MIFKEDWRYGAFDYDRDANIYDSCNCDGQFSENAVCRAGLRIPMTHDDFRAMGTCEYFDSGVYKSTAKNTSTKFLYLDKHYFESPITGDDLSPNRFLFLQIQGATHYEMRPVEVIETLLKPILTTIETQFANCMHHVKVVYTGAIVCAHFVEEKYPLQASHVSHKFNHDMHRYLQEYYPYVHFVNPWNVTREAVNRTSDGLHGLSDTNMIMVLTMLNLMHAFTKEVDTDW